MTQNRLKEYLKVKFIWKTLIIIKYLMEETKEMQKGISMLTSSMIAVINKEVESSDPMAKHRLMASKAL